MRDRRRILGPIGVRLALAMVAVAVGAVGVLGTLTLLGARGDVSQLARQEQDRAARATAAAVTDAHRAAGTWSATDLHVAAALAADGQAALKVLNAAGRPVPVPAVPGASAPAKIEGPVRSYAVVLDGKRVGTAVIHFYGHALPAADVYLRDALVRTVAAGAGLAALLGLGVAVVLSRSISRPVAALTKAVRSMGAGDRSARVGRQRGGGELAELATAFDRMADTIAREDELRRAVVADVAHELRTPLAILQAGTESLVDGVVEPTQESLVSLHEEVLRLARTVDDLDTLASADAAILSIDKQPIDLVDIAAQAIAVLRPSFEAAGVKLDANLSPARTLADPHRVDQILINLLTNALKFTEAGGTVTVTVSCDSHAASLEVADTGIGIDPGELPHVFERFWRGTQAGRLAGSGIGLAVVRSLVDAHGGTVTVASDPSEGTRVLVSFPT